MSKEEKNQSRQDSGGSEVIRKEIRLDRQKVYDFFLSEDSGTVDQKLTRDETGGQKSGEVKEDNGFNFFLPE